MFYETGMLGNCKIDKRIPDKNQEGLLDNAGDLLDNDRVLLKNQEGLLGNGED